MHPFLLFYFFYDSSFSNIIRPHHLCHALVGTRLDFRGDAVFDELKDEGHYRDIVGKADHREDAVGDQVDRQDEVTECTHDICFMLKGDFIVLQHIIKGEYRQQDSRPDLLRHPLYLLPQTVVGVISTVFLYLVYLFERHIFNSIRIHSRSFYIRPGSP